MIGQPLFFYEKKKLKSKNGDPHFLTFYEAKWIFFWSWINSLLAKARPTTSNFMSYIYKHTTYLYYYCNRIVTENFSTHLSLDLFFSLLYDYFPGVNYYFSFPVHTNTCKENGEEVFFIGKKKEESKKLCAK